MRLKSSSSLPTAPSVMKTTWRSVARRLASSEREAERRPHLGAAVGAQAATRIARLGDVAARRRQRPGKSGRVRELNSMTLKRSPLRRRSSASSSASLRLGDRDALHRAGRVDDEDHLARHALQRLGSAASGAGGSTISSA